MIRQWLTAHATRTDHRNQLRAVGLNAAAIRDLHAAGLDPLNADFPAVLAAAQIGTPPHDIPAHVRAAYRVAVWGGSRFSLLEALGLTGRLHVWGIPYDNAATLVAHIARATRGA